MTTDTADRDEQKAREIVERWCDFESVALITAIASALREARREERERCARTAESGANLVPAFEGEEWMSVHNDTCRACASAIRALEDK